MRITREPKEVHLIGGPYNKQVMYLSHSCRETLSFTAKGQTGKYARLGINACDFKWVPSKSWLNVNRNRIVITGYYV